MTTTIDMADSADSDEYPFPRPLRIECFHMDSNAAASQTEAISSSSSKTHWSPAIGECCSRYNPLRMLDGAIENICKQWRILALGQLLSFLNVANGAAQASLSLSCHLYAPLFTLGLVYFCLSLGLIPIWWKRRKELQDTSQAGDGAMTTTTTEEQNQHMPPKSQTSFVTIESFFSNSTHGTNKSLLEPAFKPDPNRSYSLLGIVPLSAPPLAYLPMATLDVWAQFFFLTSLRYTTLTSVTLLDSIAIPTAMLLSSLVLARKYRCAHFVGIFSCFIGIFMDVFQDYTAEDETGTGGADLQDYPYKIRGDMLAIMGAICFGCQEVLGEVAVRNLGGSNEYMAMLGFWACIIAMCQSYLSEKDMVMQFFTEHDQLYCAKSQAWVLLVCYIISNSCYYHGVARFLQISDAAFVSSNDVWCDGCATVQLLLTFSLFVVSSIRLIRSLI
jgi:drug/metabolite transporter (DMT)-like permease